MASPVASGHGPVAAGGKRGKHDAPSPHTGGPDMSGLGSAPRMPCAACAIGQAVSARSGDGMASSAGGYRSTMRGPLPRWVRRLLVATLAALAGTALLGLLVAPIAVKRMAEKKLGTVLGRQVSAGRVRVNPFTLSLTVDDLRIYEADGRRVFVSAARISGSLEGASLFRHVIVVRRLRVEALRVRVVHDTAETSPLAGFNFSDIVRRLRAASSSKSTRGSPEAPRVSLADVRVLASTLEFVDRPTGGRHEITALDLSVPKLSTLPQDADAFVEPAATFRLDGAAVSIRGRVRPWRRPLEATARVRIARLALKQLGRDFPVTLPFVVDAASLSAECDGSLVRRPGGAWSLRLKGHAALRQVALRGQDEGRWLDVHELDLVVRRVSLEGGAKGAGHGALDAEVELGRLGRGAVEGAIGLEPTTADLRFHLAKMDLALVAPHAERALGARLTSGELSASGRLRLATSASRRSGSSSVLELETDGEVTHLASVEARTNEPLVSWQSLRVSSLRLSTSPPALAVRAVAFDGLALRVVRRADRTWSLRAPRGHEPEGPPRRRRSIAIDEVTVRDGQFSIEDRSVRPPFVATASDILARMSGLSSRPGARARVQLSGTPTGGAAFAISGNVDVLAEDPAADFEASVKGFALPRLSPYLAKYAGYLFDAGSLDLMVDCHLEQGQLRSKNRAVIEGVRLGARVESDRATSLPVPLAVTLLKSRGGVIDLDLPLSGSFEDPSFHLGRAIGKALRNVVLKTVTSPIALVGAAFGGGHDEELAFIDFLPRGAGLDATAQGQLRTLAEAMRAHSGLSLEIEGHADPDRDRGLGAAELAALARQRATAVRDELARGQSGAACAPSSRRSARPLAAACRSESRDADGELGLSDALRRCGVRRGLGGERGVRAVRAHHEPRLQPGALPGSDARRRTPHRHGAVDRARGRREDGPLREPGVRRAAPRSPRRALRVDGIPHGAGAVRRHQ